MTADNRRVAVCAQCGGRVDRPSARYAWSHTLAKLDGDHVARPFPKQEKRSE